MLNELNKAATLPGYEHYLDGGAAGIHGGMGGMGPEHAGYDIEDAWNNDRYYTGGAGGGQRYKVSPN